jgi:uncharacterized protein YidB (DUF937 family)
MGLLDSMIGALVNNQPGVQPSAPGAVPGIPGLLGVVLAMLANGQNPQGAGVGGLGDLIGRFTRAGMGDVMSSWLGHGPNAQISGDQLTQVLGGDVISQIAAQLGLSNGEAATQLSQILPEAVDRLTPQGHAPSGGLGEISDMLSQLSPRR